MKSTIQRYRIIAIISLLILISVQFFLVYNTYKLKDEHFSFMEKDAINESYSKSIRNDKVFPGAQLIIDKYIYGNMGLMENLYKNHPAQFDLLKQKICDSIFRELRAKSNMDSLFASILKKNHFSHTLQYRLTIQSISVTFSNNFYIPLYQKGKKYPLLDPSIQTPNGIAIDGKLETASKQNLVTFLNVSSASDHSYQTGFGLYVDTPNRYLAILRLMTPTFILALLSILAVVIIYFYTFKNWLRQKKLAEMQSDFVNSITHEFHTPLSTIIVANRNLQNDKIIDNKENIHPLTKIIERQSQRLKTLFSRVLDLTVMNESTLQKKEYLLLDLLDEILLDYRLTLSDANIEIEFLKESENYEVLLDRFSFTTMIYNILENGIKYNDSKIKKIQVTVSNKNKNVGIHISDNGIGMPSKNMKDIFEKFYRNNTNISKDVSGLGLGLFYTKQCVNAHGWHMEVKSEEGVGSEFVIFIPIVKQ
ncbi:MAG TPA: HAMP domain-containing sensor histidine kinase [Hanamia sp.]|nr:HAMP domain-containing sensor histidine kinase [Hanamia sp.]